MAATVVGLLTHLGRVDTSEPLKNVLAIDGGILINWPNYRVQMTVSILCWVPCLPQAPPDLSFVCLFDVILCSVFYQLIFLIPVTAHFLSPCPLHSGICLPSFATCRHSSFPPPLTEHGSFPAQNT